MIFSIGTLKFYFFSWIQWLRKSLYYLSTFQFSAFQKTSNLPVLDLRNILACSALTISCVDWERRAKLSFLKAWWFSSNYEINSQPNFIVFPLTYNFKLLVW